MCNRYLVTALEEAQAALQAIIETPFNPAGAMIHPLGKGLVLSQRNGARTLSGMIWGFPLVLRGKQGQPLKPKPVNNARADKLASPFWSRWSGPEQRCLIPLASWAEAEGPKGSMMETWLSVPGEPVITAAGLWRPSDEWGDCYTMVMTDSAGEAAKVHDRMPVLIAPEDREKWLGELLSEVIDLCRPWQGALAIKRTTQPWVRDRGGATDFQVEGEKRE